MRRKKLILTSCPLCQISLPESLPPGFYISFPHSPNQYPLFPLQDLTNPPESANSCILQPFPIVDHSESYIQAESVAFSVNISHSVSPRYLDQWIFHSLHTYHLPQDALLLDENRLNSCITLQHKQLQATQG